MGSRGRRSARSILLTQAADALPRADAGGHHHTASPRKGSEIGEQRPQVGEVDFADADNWKNATFFGTDEIAIDKLRSEFGVGGGGDDEDLIDVGDEDMFAAVAAS